MTKEQQYQEYLTRGGTMTLEEWERDGRYDPGAEAKHTPGPWSVTRHSSNKGIVHVGPGSQYFPDEVCVLYRESMNNQSRFEANANLIAAAPDLLRALKNCREGLQLGLPVHPAYESFIKIADKAIAKAEGNGQEN